MAFSLTSRAMHGIATPLRGFALSLVMVVLSGCSFNDFGFVQVNTRETDDTHRRHFIATGLHVETRGQLAGLSIGRIEALHVHIKSCDLLAPRLHYQRMSGLQLVASGREFALTLGYRETLLASTGAANGASAVRFDPASLKRTQVEVSHLTPSNCRNQSQRKILS